MTTPGAVRTKLWRTANRQRYNEYMAKYMAKKRQKQSGQSGQSAPPENETPRDVQTQPDSAQQK